MEANSTIASLSEHVYTGFWINKAHPSPYGATITLTRQSGGFLIAFLAIYIGLVANSVWTIARFGLHFHFSSRLWPDGVYHQRQVLLKNSKTAQGALVDVYDLLFAWRGRGKAKFRRLLPVFLTAGVVALGFAIASIFSSRVTAKDSNEVVLLGKGCGRKDSIFTTEQIMSQMRDMQMRAADYFGQAQACYQSGQVGQSQQCQTNVQSSLPYEMDLDAACPFKEKICHNATGGNIILDSLPLDSYVDLGINHEPRFKLRVQQHCAPLTTDGYTTLYTEKQGNTPISYMRYNYGISNLLQDEIPNNYVYQARLNNTRDDLSSRSFFDAGSSDYSLVVASVGTSDTSSFSPVAELQRTDAQVSLIFLDQSNILYFNQTDDPWFKATTLIEGEAPALVATGTQLKWYKPDDPPSALGCASKLLLCNSDSPSDCANSAVGGEQFIKNLTTLWPDKEESAAVLGLTMAYKKIFTGPELFYSLPGMPSLLSRFTLLSSTQTDTLPSNQWQKEMEYSYQAYLASLQSGLVEASMKGAPQIWQELEACPDLEACHKLCYNQKIRTGEYYSFSVLGVFIIIFIGLFLMLVSFNIESIVGLACRRLHQSRNGDGRATQFAMLEWINNSPFHLQRLANENLGLGTWTRTADYVPVTATGDLLGVLDVTDPTHTRLRPQNALGEVEVVHESSTPVKF